MIAPGGQLQFSVGYLDNGVVASNTGRLQVLSSDPATPTTNVTLTAATEPPPVQATDIALVLNWTSTPADAHLHLVRPGSNMFNNPGDVRSCDPNPDWGTLDVRTPTTRSSTATTCVGPGPENINLTTAETGDYTVIGDATSTTPAAVLAPSTVRINLRGMRWWRPRPARSPTTSAGPSAPFPGTRPRGRAPGRPRRCPPTRP
jgi:hypothetical protein